MVGEYHVGTSVGASSGADVDKEVGPSAREDVIVGNGPSINGDAAGVRAGPVFGVSVV